MLRMIGFLSLPALPSHRSGTAGVEFFFGKSPCCGFLNLLQTFKSSQLWRQPRTLFRLDPLSSRRVSSQWPIPSQPRLSSFVLFLLPIRQNAIVRRSVPLNLSLRDACSHSQLPDEAIRLRADTLRSIEEFQFVLGDITRK